MLFDVDICSGKDDDELTKAQRKLDSYAISSKTENESEEDKDANDVHCEW